MTSEKFSFDFDYDNKPNKKPMVIVPFASKQGEWRNLEGFDIHNKDRHGRFRRYRMNDPDFHPLTYAHMMEKYIRHPEAKSLGPDGKPCTPETWGLLKRAHITAGRIRYIDKETSSMWAQGDDLTVISDDDEIGFRVVEYGKSRKVVLPDCLKRDIEEVGSRELRRKGIGQHTIEKALHAHVRVNTYRKIVAAIDEYKKENNKSEDPATGRAIPHGKERESVPKWASYYSMRKYAVTSPNVLQKLRQLDPGAARPYSFCISPIASFGNDTRVAPFNDRPQEWPHLVYVSTATGRASSLISISKDDEMITGDPNEKPQSDTPHKLKFIVQEYPKSIEHKSLAPDGSPCKEDTVGLLSRRPIQASGVVNHIGKEVARGASIDPEYLDPDEALMHYPGAKKRTQQFRYREPDVLSRLSIRKLASAARMGTKTVERFRAGKHVSQKTIKKLLKCAQKLEVGITRKGA